MSTPRSLTIAMRVMPKRLRIRAIDRLTVVGSAVLQAAGPKAFDAEQVGGILDGTAALEDDTEAIEDLRGKHERLARVFSRMRWPSRRAWRSKTAGWLARMGMISMWKSTGRCHGNTPSDSNPSGSVEPL